MYAVTVPEFVQEQAASFNWVAFGIFALCAVLIAPVLVDALAELGQRVSWLKWLEDAIKIRTAIIAGILAAVASYISMQEEMEHPYFHALVTFALSCAAYWLAPLLKKRARRESAGGAS